MVNHDLQDSDACCTARKHVRETPDLEVSAFIQRGNNGDVYFGKRIKMGDDVVLKFYWSHPHYDDTEEAVILHSINHENILKIYDLKFLPPSIAFFLTPKISGGDLQGIIDIKSLSTKEALDIISGILKGLTELHSKHQLVHRDLKPGNILFCLDKKIPIIADLGAVKKIEKANEFVTASKSTVYYLPPESVMANEYYFQSDIYQVGIILFQLLGGHFPIDSPLEWFNRKELKEYSEIRNSMEKQSKFDEIIASKITNGKIINTDTLPDYIDSPFKKVINRATNFHYEKRYSNPSAFLKDVHNLLRKHPDCVEVGAELFVKHNGGKEFKISEDLKGQIILEKKIGTKPWRKDNSHNGTKKSALAVAKAG
ncbi:serine/threonine protein kinase [Chryseobacterium sp. H3056]|uniref:Serine/threonine protein kinase n=1 Tax=Kaistella daneshvariae TaxID=2487074 RepID=A0A3N0WTG4_9FLAO|nr:serine/threonine-protein kinase [Kaistella daneshvariae]ROI08384.1 serine/threonine protein kinase [Kaistella daneshvariae]